MIHYPYIIIVKCTDLQILRFETRGLQAASGYIIGTYYITIQKSTWLFYQAFESSHTPYSYVAFYLFYTGTRRRYLATRATLMRIETERQVSVPYSNRLDNAFMGNG